MELKSELKIEEEKNRIEKEYQDSLVEVNTATGSRVIFSLNFSSIRSALSSPLEHKKKMKQTCLPVYES